MGMQRMHNKSFYRDCYKRTGWVPVAPLTRKVEVGDLCQINHSHFYPLTNLSSVHLVEPVLVSQALALNPLDWRFSQGAQQIYCTVETLVNDEGEYCHRARQTLGFAEAGNFVFHGAQPKARLLLNWSQIKDDATLKLTQLHYSFREIYLVTGVAAVDQWALTIAGKPEAQLEMSAMLNDTDYFSLLSHSSAVAELCKDIATHEKCSITPAHFFKAKKLVLSDAMHDFYLNRLVEAQRVSHAPSIANWFDADLINLTRSNELNLNTSINFFDWVDISLDDVERLLGV